MSTRVQPAVAVEPPASTTLQSSAQHLETPSTSRIIHGQLTEQLQLEQASDDMIQYPTGPQVYLNVIAILLVSFLHGLDLTIVAVVVPSLTDHFKSLEDIGWYSAVYGLMFSAFNFLFGKLYTLFALRDLYASSIIIFEIGSVICTFAQTSKMFIIGRAIAGTSLAHPHTLLHHTSTNPILLQLIFHTPS